MFKLQAAAVANYTNDLDRFVLENKINNILLLLIVIVILNFEVEQK